jgi:O-antigen ligase
MFDKWLNLPAHLYLRITALTILIVGVALSNVLMSIGTIWIISNWIIEGKFSTYWQRFKANKLIWIVVFIFFALALSLCWSSDLAYGFKDLRIKLPFIVIPLVLATSDEISPKHFQLLLYVFLGIVGFTTVYNMIHFNYYLENNSDIRNMSVFINHGRLAILINLAFFTCLAFIHRKVPYRIIWVVLAAWFLFYIFKAQTINAYLLFIILAVFSIFYFIHQIRHKGRRMVAYLLFFGGILAAGIVSFKFIKSINTTEKIDLTELELYTPNNNPYHHDTTIKEMENGHYVWLYVNQQEMKKEWELKSEIPYDSLDRIGQPMYGTLMRYLTSLGFRKDSMGVAQLTPTDIEKIEDGHTSAHNNKGLASRISTFLIEYNLYKQGGNPNGNSFFQRIEHLKAAQYIIAHKYLLGVGIGDVPGAFTDAYQKTNSKLNKEIQYRSHNQYLTIWVSLGIFGLIAFVLMLFLPFFYKNLDYFFYIVMISLVVSCLFEDSIETQAGVTIFALFYSLANFRGLKKIS